MSTTRTARHGHSASRSQPPRRHDLSGDRKLETLVRNVRKALSALPAYFRTSTRIEGLDAGDLFNLNSVLGATIEVQVVDSLNRIRQVWDPDGRWPRHHFVRSAQTFPDVRLAAHAGDEDRNPDVALGIELKGWYLLSKEKEPSFRYRVTPRACAPQDLLVVVPWHLKNVLSGEPVVHEPYIEQARYAAEFRNWWWTNERQTRDSPPQRQIVPPEGEVGHYPAPKARIDDQPAKDGGGNFGRIARIPPLMDDYTSSLRAQPIAGIPAEHWISFFKLHAEAKDDTEILERLSRDLTERGLSDEAAGDVADAIYGIVKRFR